MSFDIGQSDIIDHDISTRTVSTPDPLTVDYFRDSIGAINQVIVNKKIKLVRFTEVSLMEDETYGASEELKPLPQC